MAGTTALRLSVTGAEDIARALKALGVTSDESFGQVLEGARKASVALKSLGEVKPDFSGLGRAAENVLQLAASADKLNAATVPQIQLLQRQVEVNDQYSRGLIDRKTVTEALIAAHDKENAALAAGLGGQRQQLDYNLQLVAAAQRYREALDPSIALDRRRAEVMEQVRIGALEAADAYAVLTQAALKAAGVTADPSRQLPGSVGQFANVKDPDASAGRTVEDLQAYQASVAAEKQEAEALAKLRAEADQVRLALDPMLALKKEEARLAELVDAEVLKETESKARLAQVTEQLTGAQAQARAATAEALADYERLVASADRYRESVTPAIALDKLRAETLEQVGVQALTAAEAYDKLKAAALARAGLELQPGQAAPSSVERFATVGAGGGSAEGAIADAKALAAANAAAAESTDKLRAEAEAENATYTRLKAAVDPYIAVQRLRVEVDAAVASGALKQVEANTLVAAATTRAAASQRAMEEASRGVTGATTLMRQNLLFATFDLNRLFDSLNSGQRPLTAFAIEIPKILDTLAFASGSSLLAVGGLAVGLGVALFHLAEGHAEAKAKADEHKQSLDGLTASMHLQGASVDELTDSYGRLNGSQKDLIDANMAVQIDKQAESLKTARAELDDFVKSTIDASQRQAAAGAGGVGGVTEFGGALPEQTGVPKTLSEDLKKQYDIFKAGADNIDALRIAFELEQESEGKSVEQAQALAAEFVKGATEVRTLKEAHDLLVATYAVEHGSTNQQYIDLVNSAEAMKTAGAAAKAYADTLANLQQRQTAGSKADEFVLQQERAAHLDQIGANLPDDQRTAAQAEAKTEIDVEARRTFAANQQIEVTKKLEEAEQEHLAVQKELAAGTDKVALAGDKAADAKRKELGVEAAATDEGRKVIALAKTDAEARERQTASITAAGKAKTEAARQDEFARKSAQELADSEKALADAQQGGLAQTREAVALRQAEREVLAQGFAVDDRRYANLVREHQQTILNNQATQEAAKYEKDLQALRDKGDNADKGVAFDAGGKSLDVGQIGALSGAQLKEALDRAAAVKQALDKLGDNETSSQAKLAKDIQVAVEAYNKELAAKQQIAAVGLSDKARQELEYAQQRLVIDQQVEPVRQQMLAQLAAENELLAAGIDLEKLRYDPQVIQAYADLVHANLVKQQDDEQKAAEKRKQQLTDEIIAQPFKDLASTIGSSLTDGLQQFESQGLPGLLGSLQSFAGKLSGIGNQFASNLLTLPLNKALAQFEATLGDAGPNGGFGAALSQLFQQHPIVAGLGVGGVIGGIGGSIGAQISGNANTATGGSFGGLAGGVAGTLIGGPIGGIIGGALGTALGSVLGGFFGGGSTGKNNDAQGFIYSPYTGDYTKTDKQGSPQNTQAARQLAEQSSGALDILSAAGLDYGGHNLEFKVGNNSGVEYDRQQYASNQDALKAAIRDLIDNTTGTITDTLKTVLANTKAESAQQLQQDIQFAATYDQLTNKTGAYGQALVDLDTQYRTAEAQAKKLGLSTDDLATALAEAEKDLKDKAVQQLKALIGDSGAAGQAIFDLRQKFKDVAKDAAALGYTQQQLADGEAKQEAKLREQYHFQAEALTGAFGPLGQSILQIRNNFDQARQIFLDLGESVEGLAEKQAAAERKAYADAEKQLQQQLSGQAQQVRGFLDGLVNPLKQALSGLGPLSGYVSPQQSIAGGLAEFRKTFASAGNDNAAAIQNLPQEAEQLLQLARSSLGSGPQFAAIFAEVKRDLQSVLTAQEGRANQVEATLPSTEQTAQQQLDALQSGFQDTVDALARLHDDWRQLGGGLGVPANVNARLDAGSVAAAFAPQLVAQQQGNTLIAGVSDAVRLVGSQQTDAMARMTTALVDRLDRLERRIGQMQPGRLGNAA